MSYRYFYSFKYCYSYLHLDKLRQILILISDVHIFKIDFLWSFNVFYVWSDDMRFTIFHLVKYDGCSICKCVSYAVCIRLQLWKQHNIPSKCSSPYQIHNLNPLDVFLKCVTLPSFLYTSEVLIDCIAKRWPFCNNNRIITFKVLEKKESLNNFRSFRISFHKIFALQHQNLYGYINN